MHTESPIPDTTAADMYRRILDGLSSPVAVVSAEGNIGFTNEAWRQLAESIGASATETAEGADWRIACGRLAGAGIESEPELTRGMSEVLNGDAPSFEVQPGAGTSVDATAWKIRLTRMGGAPQCTILTLEKNAPSQPERSIVARELSDKIQNRNTELEQLNRSLRENQWRLSEAQRIAHVGHWDRDLDKSNARWSDEIYRILGRDPANTESTFHTFFDLVHPDDRDGVREAIHYARLHRSDLKIEFRIIRPDGQIRHLQDRAEIEFDAEGNPVRMFGTIQDITEQKRVESQLRDQAIAHSIRTKIRDADRNLPDTEAWRFLLAAIVDGFEIAGGWYGRKSEQRLERICEHGHLDQIPDSLDLGDAHQTYSAEQRAIVAAVTHGRCFHGANQTEPCESGCASMAPSPRAGGIHLAVPVAVDARIIGGILLFSDNAGAFPAERVRHIQDLANEMGERICRLRFERDAAEASRRSERQLLQVIAEMPIMMIAFDANGSIVAWNHECERVTGFSASEIVGKPESIERLYPEQKQKEVFVNHWLLESGEFRDWELTTNCRDGGQRTIAWSRVSDQFPIPGWAKWGIGIDVTERRMAERALAQSERDYRGLFDNAHDAIIIFRPHDEIVLEANPHACQLYGLSRSEFIGMSLLDISQDVARGQRKIAETMRLGQNVGFETTQYRSDGSAMLLEINAAVIEYRGELAILTINRDITNRRTAEDSVRNSEARYRWLADHSTDIILRISTDGTIMDASHASRAILGYAPDELVGRRCVELVTRENRDAMNAMIQRAMVERGPHRIALRFHCQGQDDRWLECLIEGLRNPENTTVREIVAVARDMSLRKQEEELRELRSMELSHVNRLITLGEMAGQIAHQLHQPLTAISNYAGTMRNLIRKTNGGGEAHDLEPYCDEIVRSAVRTGEFIHRIRAFTQRRGLRRSQTRLSTIMSNAFGLCEIRLQRMTVHTSYFEATDLPEIVVDTIQIEQVLVNLINNAIDAMTMREAGNRRLSVTAHVEPPTHVRVCVRDTGIGLQDDGQRLFQPFYTTKADGVGMGLVISRRIVEAHGGKLWIESHSEGGTSVFFTISLGEENDDNT